MRLDLAGGWCDCPAYTDQCEDAATVNIAVEPCCTCAAGPRRDEHLEVHIASPPGIGPGSGLGLSASLAVAHVACVRGIEAGGRERLAEQAYAYERSLNGQITGRQDHYAAAVGGFRLYEWGCTRDGCEPRVRDLDPDRSASEWLWQHSSVFHTGHARKSGNLHEAVWGQPISTLVPTLSMIAQGARRAADAVGRRDLGLVADVVDEQRRLAADLHQAADVPELDQILNALGARGTAGAKPLGAGGGGCVLVIHEPELRHETGRQAESLGWRRVEWMPSSEGATVEG